MATFNICELIMSKSQGCELTSNEIRKMVEAISDNSIEQCQIGALLMAIKLRGMTLKETKYLTEYMVEFSKKFNWSNKMWKNQVVDKHSTGGIGDKISHILVPILAACGLKVPMLTGRGLGITGGTIDKLEAIEGFQPKLSAEEMDRALEECGCFIIAQTEEFVPVDKILYAIRDISATIDSIPLITASILSKKKVEDLNVLLMDIKFGNGTFCQTKEEAEKLAKSIQETGQALDIKIICLITNMNIPLGRCVGNALEIAEVLQFLNGFSTEDLRELVFTMAIELIVAVDKTKTIAEAEKLVSSSIVEGTALRKFADMLSHHKVHENLIKKLTSHSNITIAKYLDIMNYHNFHTLDLKSPKSGFIHSINSKKIGTAVRDLGAGRKKTTDTLKYDVGVELLVKEFEKINKDQPWIRIRFDSSVNELEKQIIDMIAESLVIKENKPAVSKKIEMILK